MKRRQFITLLGGAAAAWPVGAWAQQSTMPVVGWLSSGGPTVFLNVISSFRQGLAETGFIEGKAVTFEHLTAEGNYERFGALAEELVRRRVSVIFATGGTLAALAAKRATSEIPIVFYAGSDPVKLQLVDSLNRPGSNVTGLTSLGPDLVVKRLELLRELVPGIDTVEILVNPTNPDTQSEILAVELASKAFQLKTSISTVTKQSEFELLFSALAERRTKAVLVASDAFLSSQRQTIVALASQYSLPLFYERRDYPVAGGLLSYGQHRGDAYRQLGVYVGRILKGDKPADLPVLQPTKFELVINLKTAKALNLTVPPTLLARADEVIE